MDHFIFYLIIGLVFTFICVLLAVVTMVESGQLDVFSEMDDEQKSLEDRIRAIVIDNEKVLKSRELLHK